MSEMSEIIQEIQERNVPGTPKHSASDEDTIRVMNWISQETKTQLKIGDIWVNDDSEAENLSFGFSTSNGEASIIILADKITKGTLETQLGSTEPFEIVVA